MQSTVYTMPGFIGPVWCNIKILRRKESSNMCDCDTCPLGWEEGYEYKEGGCLVDENPEWCNKPIEEREEKAKEIEDVYDKYWEEEGKRISEYFSKHS